MRMSIYFRDETILIPKLSPRRRQKNGLGRRLFFAIRLCLSGPGVFEKVSDAERQ